MEARFADIPNKLWDLVVPTLPKEPSKPFGGRPRVSDRQILAGIVYRLKTGCQWKALPEVFGSGSTCHRRFSEWVDRGVFVEIWEVLLEFYEIKKSIDWKWTSLDAAIIKAPKGGILRARTRRTAPRAAARGMSSRMAGAYRSA
jgi:transposase